MVATDDPDRLAAGASERTYLDALLGALSSEMERDDRIVVLGEDLRSGIYGDGAFTAFGSERIWDTPISEAGFVGAAIGAAITGMRPLVDLGSSSFLFCCMDQIVNQAAKSRYMYGGQASVPIVIRSNLYYGGSVAAHHADRPYGLFMQVPGLKIAIPASPQDAATLLRAALRDDDPVLFFDDISLWSTKEIVDESLVEQLGVARIRRSGTDVTVVGIAGGVPLALAVADELEATGIGVEVIDPRTIVPLDLATILESVQRTKRLVIVDPAPRTAGVAAELSAAVAEQLFSELRAPVMRVASHVTPMPFSPVLERAVLPSRADLRSAILASLSVERK